MDTPFPGKALDAQFTLGLHNAHFQFEDVRITSTVLLFLRFQAFKLNTSTHVAFIAAHG